MDGPKVSWAVHGRSTGSPVILSISWDSERDHDTAHGTSMDYPWIFRRAQEALMNLLDHLQTVHGRSVDSP